MTRSLPGSQVKKIKVLGEVCPLYWAHVTTVADCGPSWTLSFLVSEKHLSIMYSKGPGWSSCKRKKKCTPQKGCLMFLFLPTSVFLRFTSWVSGLCPLSQGSQIMSRWKSLSSFKKKINKKLWWQRDPLIAGWAQTLKSQGTSLENNIDMETLNNFWTERFFLKYILWP